jgi:DNA-binding IclR family transcriptional regulator
MKTNHTKRVDAAAGTVKSADRVIAFFELLSLRGRDLTHSEIAADLGIPKGSLSKLLKNLEQRGHVQFVKETKGYRFGPAFLDLARQAIASRDIVALSGNVLATVSDATNESCALILLRGDEVEIVSAIDAPHHLLAHLNVGDRIPLYASSGGKAFLAFVDENTRSDYLDRVVLKPLTRHTLTDKVRLRREIESVQRDGVAYSRQEVSEGVMSIGIPVLSKAGHPLATLNIAMPTLRFDEEKRLLCIAELKKGASRLRSLLGDVTP